MMTRVLTICHEKPTQNTHCVCVRAKAFDLRSLSPSLRNLSLLLVHVQLTVLFSYCFDVLVLKEYEAARKLFVEIKKKKDEVKKSLEEARKQNGPMQKRLDEVMRKARELEESTRELVRKLIFSYYLTYPS